MLRQLFFLTTMDEEQVEDILERFPKLGERVRDWVVIAKEGGKVIIHAIMDLDQAQRLYQRPEYLGHDYKNIAQRAKAGDVTCKKVIKRIVFTTWEIDNPDPEGPERINYRGGLGEWITAKRPTRLSGWFPAHVWLGQEIANVSENDV